MLLNLSQIARLARLPEGMDPADCFKNGKRDVVDQAIKESKDFITYLIDQIPETDSHVTLLQNLRPVLDHLKVFPSDIQEAYLHDFKKKFSISTDELKAFRSEFKEAKNNEVKNSAIQKPIQQIALLDEILDLSQDAQGNPTFLVLEKNELVSKKQIETSDFIYIPPPKKAMTWLLPKSEEVIKYFKEDNDESVFKEILNVLKTNIELPDHKLYAFFAAWVIHTHLIKEARYSPIIILYSDAGHGKTRLGKLLIFLARSGEITESLNEANLFRKAERFEASIFFDVLDIWKKAEKKDSQDILLCRFERDHVVPRVLNPEKSNFEDTSHFKVFGPTIIASNESAHEILQSRGALVYMQESIRQFPDLPTREELLPLKERLTALHARHALEKLPNVEKPASHRLGDILKPIYQILNFVSPSDAQKFPELVAYFEKGRAEANTDSMQAQVLIALLEFEDSPSSFNAGSISISAILEKVNRDRPKHLQSTTISIGKRLKLLGFNNGKRSGNNRTIVRDKHYQTLLNRLSIKYGLAEPEKSGSPGVSGEHAGNIKESSASSDPSSGDHLAENCQDACVDSHSDSSSQPAKPDFNYETEERLGMQNDGGEDDYPF